MYWLVLVLDCNDKAETFKFDDANYAQGTYQKHVTMMNDKYVALLSCNGRVCVPLATYSNQQGV